MYIYYLPDRKAEPTSVPRGFKELRNFSSGKIWISRIGMEAYGYVIYDELFTIEELIKWNMIYGDEIKEAKP